MKRSYTYSGYRKIVEKLHAAIPNIAISTDIIVGFPGETETQFERTLKSVEELHFDQAFMFIYSPRRHTEALQFANEAVPPDVQKQRLQRLIDAANELFQRKNQADLDRSVEVLVEGPSEKNPAKLSGRTRQNKTVVFNGSRELIGTLVHVRPRKAFLWGFEGELVRSHLTDN